MNIYSSRLIEQAQTQEEIVEAINAGGVTEGVEGVEFTAEQLAGEYAWQAAEEAGYVDDDSLEGQLECLADAGADFSQSDALEHAKLFRGAAGPARPEQQERKP